MIARPRRFVVALCGACLVAGSLRAQTSGYARPSGDTLRFRETVTIDGVTKGRAGDVTMVIRQDARLSIAFVNADSAHAWYDSLSMDANGPGGKRALETASALRAPFVLRMRSDGTVETLHTPELPTTLRDLADYIPQFEDFFPRLPADLTPGSTRTDTVTRKDAREQRKVLVQRIVRLRVERDTVVDGTRAVVLSINGALHVESSTPMRQENIFLDIALDGPDNGTAIVSRDGKLLSRERSADIKGKVSYRGAGTVVPLDQRYTYRESVVAVGKN